MRLPVGSSKGGVGKTSTAADLAAVLGARGRVLAVDADPQDSLGRAFGVVAKSREDSLAGLLEDPDADVREAIRTAVAPPLSAVAAADAVLTVTVTPLRWSLAGLDATEGGLGIAVKIGPVRLEIAL